MTGDKLALGVLPVDRVLVDLAPVVFKLCDALACSAETIREQQALIASQSDRIEQLSKGVTA